MRVIPVLDLMGGQVVQGIQGDRARYRPVKSVLTPSSAPLEVASRLQRETGSEALYIADLDAIEKRGDHRSVIRELSQGLSAELWVDGGASDADAVQYWLDAGVDRVVVGSETLDSMASLQSIRAKFPSERLVFSLDVQKGQVLSRCAEIQARSPFNLLVRLSTAGWTHVIVLALDRVGTGGGPDWLLLETLCGVFPELSLIAGGGVRGIDDLHRLSRTGLSGVLLASALHRGWLTGHDLHALTSEPKD